MCRTCKEHSKPYILTPHGVYSRYALIQKSYKKIIYLYLFGDRCIANAKAIRFTAEGERIKALEALPILKKIPNFIVPNGIDFTKIKKEKNIRSYLNIPEDKFVILLLGRVHRKKGIHFILEALKKLNSDKYVALIVGNREDKKYVRYLEKLSAKIKTNVIWHDSVTRDEVWDFYYASNLLMLPSYGENFGMVLVEAMACGVPVLISKNVDIWETIQSRKAGFVVPQDKDAIAEVLESVLKNSADFKLMSENAKILAEDKYDIRKVASLIIKGYDDILSQKKSSELQWN
jgi:glycosyltransferase involved in cell wall biosynthesis